MIILIDHFELSINKLWSDLLFSIDGAKACPVEILLYLLVDFLIFGNLQKVIISFLIWDIHPWF